MLYWCCHWHDVSPSKSFLYELWLIRGVFPLHKIDTFQQHNKSALLLKGPYWYFTKFIFFRMSLTLAPAGRPPCSWGWGAHSWAQSETSGVLTCAGASPCRLGREESGDDRLITGDYTARECVSVLWILWASSDILNHSFITSYFGRKRRQAHPS